MIRELSFAAVGVAVTGLLCAQEPKTEESPGAKLRLQLMQDTIAGFRTGDDDKSAAKFVAKPLLRYSDPTRGLVGSNALLDAGVWRLGEKGRPLALVTLEIYGKGEGEAILSYEFLALTGEKLSLSHQQNKTVKWNSAGKDAVSLKPLPNAPPPATIAAARLVQMRTFARRFKVHETLKQKGEKEEVECRLLSQPIDRYQDGKEIVDGAIFAYANGTNPEVGVLLECNADRWSYGVIRLSSAELRVTLDGDEVAQLPTGDFRYAKDSNYFAAGHPIKLAE
jgi:hypothetical protein